LRQELTQLVNYSRTIFKNMLIFLHKLIQMINFKGDYMVLKLKYILFITIIIFTNLSAVLAHVKPPEIKSNDNYIINIEKRSFDEDNEDVVSKIQNKLTINYLSIFFGPGLRSDTFSYTPNELGMHNTNGWFTQNQISFKYKISKNFSFNTTFRINLVLNNDNGSKSYKFFRWETPRMGIATVFFKKGDWLLVGSLDTETPSFMPYPLTGYQAKSRTALFTPGMNAIFQYDPSDSPWSILSTLEPRYYFYENADAAEESYLQKGLRSARNKPNLTLVIKPTISYRISSKAKITLGTILDYRKQVLSGWDPFKASLSAMGDSPAWRVNPIPIHVGISYDSSKSMSIYPYISMIPIKAQRFNAKTGLAAKFSKTCHFGMWIRGNIF
jgi:hypothetical protein